MPAKKRPATATLPEFPKMSAITRGFSLIEMCVVVAVVATVAAIGIPIFLSAVDAVRGFAVLLNGVVIR